jgi:hypothetical protein
VCLGWKNNIKICRIIRAEDKPGITDTKEKKLLHLYGHVEQTTQNVTDNTN